MNSSEFRLKTGLLGYSARDLDSTFSSLDGQAQDVLDGHAPVPAHVGAVVKNWWEELEASVANAVEDAEDCWMRTGAPFELKWFEHFSQLPKERGAFAENLQGWEYQLGLVIHELEARGVPFVFVAGQDQG